MFSRSIAHRRVRRGLLTALLGCVLVCGAATLAEARIYIRGGQQGASEYESQIASAGSAEGDVWGGEQITTPEPEVVGSDVPTAHEDSVPRVKVSPWHRFWTRIATLVRHFGL